MKRITILIDTEGKTVVTTSGYSGAACQKASEFIEKALGSKVKEKLTQEFYDACPSQLHTSQ